MSSAVSAIEMRQITRRFPGVIANDQVDFSARWGEVHALVGENGAGKTTLMNVLYGLHPPDSGEILLYGERAEIGNPRDAIARGIGMVHQHFMLVQAFTALENVILGAEPVTLGRTDYRLAQDRVQRICVRFQLQVNLSAPDHRYKSRPHSPGVCYEPDDSSHPLLAKRWISPDWH